MSAPAGPYIVTWREGRHTTIRYPQPPLSRWAYATLEEARGFVSEQFNAGPGDQFGSDHYLPGAGQADDLPESGGTIKLPDGEIVVEATDYNRLWDELTPDHEPELLAGVDLTIWIDGAVADDRWGTAILAAWNAEYGIGEGA